MPKGTTGHEQDGCKKEVHGNMKKTDEKNRAFENVLDVLKTNKNYIIAFIVFVFFLFFGFTSIGQTVELSMYDALLKIKPETAERSDVLLLNVDDLAIEEVGTWPWSRDVFADVLIQLRELGGQVAVFDIEYLSPGQAGVNREYVQGTLPQEYKNAEAEITEYVADFSQAIQTESIPVSEAAAVGADMNEYIRSLMDGLSSSISQNVFRDNDAYFGEAVHFFGNTFLTINAVNINIDEGAEQNKKYAFDTYLFDTVIDEGGYIKQETLAARAAEKEEYGIAPAIYPLLSQARGAGFPNVIIDTDGVRRRIPLFNEYEGKYVGQLVFTPIISILQPEQIIRSKNAITLKNAKNPRNFSARKDIKIPLDANGRMLINWLKQPFTDAKNPENSSFKHLSVYALVYAGELEETLVQGLADIKDLEIRTADGYLSYNDAVVYLQAVYADLKAKKQALLENKANDYEAYFAARKSFFEDYKSFLDGEFDAEIHDVFKQIKESSGSTAYDAVDAYVTDLFSAARDNFKTFTDHRKFIEETCAGTFAVIGYSGVGTSDLGTNPFWKAYANVGTHANIYNTIMNEDFITPLSPLVSLLAAFFLAAFIAFVLQRITVVYVKLLFGFALAISLMVIEVFLFTVFNIYIEIFMPLMTVIVSFLIITLLNFIFSEQEKSFLRKAFGVYLSDDVVNEIVADPDRLALGGEEKFITALFTDIRSFSTLSEKITPEHLVSVLNVYLTDMSDLILEQKGTIDKYIGDAIVAFFGAPNDLPDHAVKACFAALRMKEAEAELNKKLYDSGEIPMPIFTRIGVNSGNMVVGNMGTDKKMNYTIMGNDVNLAARLEGVNKKYGTWILASQATWEQTNGLFLGRRLDRVRVVGINTPVQLYNVMAVKNEASENMLRLVETFEPALTLYRERKYGEALTAFKGCLEIIPDDAPTQMYIDRIQELVDNPALAETHDDVYNMTSK